MVAITPVRFDCFAVDIAHKKHDFSSDTLKLLLTNTEPSATDLVKSDLTEIAATGGYVAGGLTIPVASSSQTAGAYRLAVSDAVLLAAGAAIPSWQWAVLYNASSPSQPLMLSYDYGSTVSIPDGGGFRFSLDTGGGVINFNPVAVDDGPALVIERLFLFPLDPIQLYRGSRFLADEAVPAAPASASLWLYLFPAVALYLFEED